jgi:hypothetical protein
MWLIAVTTEGNSRAASEQCAPARWQAATMSWA